MRNKTIAIVKQIPARPIQSRALFLIVASIAVNTALPSVLLRVGTGHDVGSASPAQHLPKTRERMSVQPRENLCDKTPTWVAIIFALIPSARSHRASTSAHVWLLSLLSYKFYDGFSFTATGWNNG